MPKIDAAIGIRVTKDLKARLERQAKSEMKSVSALIIQVMEDYLSQKGLGRAEPPQEQKGRRRREGCPAALGKRAAAQANCSKGR